MKPQIGSRLSVAIAQNGIFLRLFAAATYGGSGLGGGGAAGAALAGAAAGAAGVLAATVAGAFSLAAGASAGGGFAPERCTPLFRSLQQMLGNFGHGFPFAASVAGRARVSDYYVRQQ
jgi:hypothetical protein